MDHLLLVVDLAVDVFQLEAALLQLRFGGRRLACNLCQINTVLFVPLRNLLTIENVSVRFGVTQINQWWSEAVASHSDTQQLPPWVASDQSGSVENFCFFEYLGLHRVAIFLDVVHDFAERISRAAQLLDRLSEPIHLQAHANRPRKRQPGATRPRCASPPARDTGGQGAWVDIWRGNGGRRTSSDTTSRCFNLATSETEDSFSAAVAVPFFC